MIASIIAAPLHVLVVDDCRDTSQSMALLLQCWGHTAETADNVADALRRAADSRPDVVLLDVGMAGGWDLACRLRRLPEIDGVLLVALTGLISEEARERSHQVGCDLHLLKPLEPNELHELLSRHRCFRPVTFTPATLRCQVNDLGSAADVVEAIDDLGRQRERGWDLTGWRYELIPWGVRFLYRSTPDMTHVEVCSLVAFPALALGTGTLS